MLAQAYALHDEIYDMPWRTRVPTLVSIAAFTAGLRQIRVFLELCGLAGAHVYDRWHFMLEEAEGAFYRNDNAEAIMLLDDVLSLCHSALTELADRQKFDRSVFRHANRTAGAGSAWLTRTMRAQIYKRDKYDCAYCLGKRAVSPELTIDHIFPSIKGGADRDPKNLITSCCSCNSQKQKREVMPKRAGFYPPGSWFHYLKKTKHIEDEEIEAIKKRLNQWRRRKLPKVSSDEINAVVVVHRLFWSKSMITATNDPDEL